MSALPPVASLTARINWPSACLLTGAEVGRRGRVGGDGSVDESTQLGGVA